MHRVPARRPAGRLALSAAIIMTLISACGADDGRESAVAREAGSSPYAGYSSSVYGGGTRNWLCHPQLTGSANACNGDLETILVSGDGRAELQPFMPATAPEVDCFYVYPTTSADAGANSDLNPDVQEIQTTLQQAARFGAVCRMFAPVYRQRTLTWLALSGRAGQVITEEQLRQADEIAYQDVLDAFKAYVAEHQNGRGFLLLGHSQGARLLARLIAEEVESQPYLRQHMIAAYIPGVVLPVPKDAEVGGAFQLTPPCRAATQTGCVINYASYREGDPELAAPRYGRTDREGMQAMCVNPAALAGGQGTLEPHLPFVLPPVFQALLTPRGSGGPYAQPASNLQAAAQAPFFGVPGQIRAECVEHESGAHVLSIRITADPADPRADDYPGEFRGGTGWGLHLADMNLTQGNLLGLAQSQSAAWLQRQGDAGAASR